MYFSAIELHNFGIYRGTQRIELSDAVGQHNVTLIGGLNGRGKTTLIEAIFLIFFGKRSLQYISDKKRKYDSLLKSYINKTATDATTYISATFMLDNDIEYKVTRSWTRDGNKTAEILSVTKNGIHDSYLSENWNFYIEDILPFGISRFFFFDNEKISQIADDESFDEIKDSIKAVMGVTTIDKLLDDINRITKEKRNALQSLENSDLMVSSARVEDDIVNIEAAIAKARLDKSGLVPRLEKVEAELETTEQNFWKQGGNLGVKREEIEREKAKLKNEEVVLKQKIMDLVINSATPIVMCQKLLRQVYNEAKEVEAHRTLEQTESLIQDILSRLTRKIEEILVDANIRNQVRKAIVEELAGYRQSKGFEANDTSGLTPVSIMLIEKLLQSGVSEIQSNTINLQSEIEENDNALLQIDIHLSTNAEKSGALELLNMIRDLERTSATLQHEIQKCDETIQSLEGQKSALEINRNKIIKKLAEMENTYDDDSRILAYSAKTVDVMNEFKLRLQRKKVKELEENITECFCELAEKESIISKVEINSETLDITLRDYAGGILHKSQLSAGEKQMFAISIIWGLALSSGYRLPVVIDTPMARLDSIHRHNFINKYLPKASSQVIVLSTDEEVNGKYLHQIEDYVNRYYVLKYDEHEKCTSILPGYFMGINYEH